MATTSIRTTSPEESSAKQSSRAERALELYRTHGYKIARLSENVYRVPSQDGTRSYDVLYGEREECPCADYQYRGQYRGVACVHLMTMGISVAKRRGATRRNLAALEEDLAHEFMDDEERQEVRDHVLRLRRRLGY